MPWLFPIAANPVFINLIGFFPSVNIKLTDPSYDDCTSICTGLFILYPLRKLVLNGTRSSFVLIKLYKGLYLFSNSIGSESDSLFICHPSGFKEGYEPISKAYVLEDVVSATVADT